MHDHEIMVCTQAPSTGAHSKPVGQEIPTHLVRESSGDSNVR